MHKLCSCFAPIWVWKKIPLLVPLTLREWNLLARKIQASNFNRPGGLLGQTCQDLSAQLELSGAEAERLSNLLARIEGVKC